jgi:tetratricopeptide (TPR) repeat protein
LLALVVASPVVCACVNEMATNAKGQPVKVTVSDAESLRYGLMHAGPARDDVQHARDVIEAFRERPDDEHLNDLAVVLIRLGRPEKAIEVLQRIERRHPGRYQTATNLGTAYELAGRNDDALRWIREGIRRNPASHDGTEWLHARILEAKVAAPHPAGAPPVLALDFGRGLMPRLPARLPPGNDGRPVTPHGLATALAYQLTERTWFVRPRDPWVASLFYDWGNLEMAAGALEFADVAYEFAERYGHPEHALIARRRAEIARIEVSPFKRFRSIGECLTCADGDG